MSYKNYLEKFNAGGILDIKNPFFSQAVSFTPTAYTPLGLVEEAQILSQQPEPDKLPDASKIKELLMKEKFLPEDAKVILNNIKAIESEISDALKTNPYALRNDGNVIRKFNELQGLLLSPTMQTAISNREQVAKQAERFNNPATKEAQNFIKVNGEFVPVTYQNAYASLSNRDVNSFIDKNADGTINTSNISTPSGTLENFQEDLKKAYEKVNKDKRTDGQEGASFTFLDANMNSVQLGESEISSVLKTKGGRTYTTDSNYDNLRRLHNRIINNQNLEDIFSPEAINGLEQASYKKMTSQSLAQGLQGIVNITTIQDESKLNEAQRKQRQQTLANVEAIKEFFGQDINRVDLASLKSDIAYVQRGKASQFSSNSVRKKIATLAQNPQALNIIIGYLDALNAHNKMGIVANNLNFAYDIFATRSVSNVQNQDLSFSDAGGAGLGKKEKAIEAQQVASAMRGLFLPGGSSTTTTLPQESVLNSFAFQSDENINDAYNAVIKEQAEKEVLEDYQNGIIVPSGRLTGGGFGTKPLDINSKEYRDLVSKKEENIKKGASLINAKVSITPLVSSEAKGYTLPGDTKKIPIDKSNLIDAEVLDYSKEFEYGGVFFRAPSTKIEPVPQNLKGIESSFAGQTATGVLLSHRAYVNPDDLQVRVKDKDGKISFIKVSDLDRKNPSHLLAIQSISNIRKSESIDGDRKSIEIYRIVSNPEVVFRGITQDTATKGDNKAAATDILNSQQSSNEFINMQELLNKP